MQIWDWIKEQVYGSNSNSLTLTQVLCLLLLLSDVQLGKHLVSCNSSLTSSVPDKNQLFCQSDKDVETLGKMFSYVPFDGSAFLCQLRFSIVSSVKRIWWNSKKSLVWQLKPWFWDFTNLGWYPFPYRK